MKEVCSLNFALIVRLLSNTHAHKSLCDLGEWKTAEGFRRWKQTDCDLFVSKVVIL